MRSDQPEKSTLLSTSGGCITHLHLRGLIKYKLLPSNFPQVPTKPMLLEASSTPKTQWLVNKPFIPQFKLSLTALPLLPCTLIVSPDTPRLTFIIYCWASIN